MLFCDLVARTLAGNQATDEASAGPGSVGAAAARVCVAALKRTLTVQLVRVRGPADASAQGAGRCAWLHCAWPVRLLPFHQSACLAPPLLRTQLSPGHSLLLLPAQPCQVDDEGNASDADSTGASNMMTVLMPGQGPAELLLALQYMQEMGVRCARVMVRESYTEI